MISVKNLYKDFGKLRVLDNVSLDIKKGEQVVIIGASGSGKSTLLRCLNFLEQPTYGEIWYNDRLLGEPDPYLHFDVIAASRTYKKLEKKADSILDKKDGYSKKIIYKIYHPRYYYYH